jgi:hypothetical protein
MITMHIVEVEEDQSGWFPAIGIKISRFSDLLLVMLAVGLCLYALFVALTTGKKMLGNITRRAASLLTGVAIHVFSLLFESTESIYHTVLRIPVSWYPTAALTVLPVAIDIPRWASIMYLLAYCAANAWIMASGIPTKETKTHETTSSSKTLKQPTVTPGSQMFAGMRIIVHD